MSKGYNKVFNQRGYTNGDNKKKYLTSVAIQEMQIKISVSYHYTCITMTKTKNSESSKCW